MEIKVDSDTGHSTHCIHLSQSTGGGYVRITVTGLRMVFQRDAFDARCKLKHIATNQNYNLLPVSAENILARHVSI